MGEGFFSRRFRGRGKNAEGDGSRVPAGQYLGDGFSVLSVGPTPRTSVDEWDFATVGEIDEPRRWTGETLLGLPSPSRSRATSTASPSGRSWTPPGKGSPWTPFSKASKPLPSTSSPSATGATLRTFPGGGHGRQSLNLLLLRWRAARPGARRPRAPAGPPPLLLEERQVGAGPDASKPGRARFLGVFGLP